MELLNLIERRAGCRSDWEMFLIYLYKRANWGANDGLEKNELRVDLDAIAGWVYGTRLPSKVQKNKISRYIKKAIELELVTRRFEPQKCESGQVVKGSILAISNKYTHAIDAWTGIKPAELLEKVKKENLMLEIMLEVMLEVIQKHPEIITKSTAFDPEVMLEKMTEIVTFLDPLKRSMKENTFVETEIVDSDDSGSEIEAKMKRSIARDDETAHDLVDSAPKPLPPLTQEQAFATEDPAKAILDHERKRDTLFLPQEFIWLGVIFWVLKACWYDLDCTTPEPQVPKKKLAYPLLGALRRYSQTGKLDANTAYWICNALIFMRDKVHDGSWQTGWLSHIVLHDRPLGNAIHRVKKHFDETGEAYSMPESVFGDPKATYEAGRDIWVPNAMTAFQARASVREAQRHTHLVSDVAQMLTQKALAQSQEKE